jgi:hypothetical protein
MLESAHGHQSLNNEEGAAGDPGGCGEAVARHEFRNGVDKGRDLRREAVSRSAKREVSEAIVWFFAASSGCSDSRSLEISGWYNSEDSPSLGTAEFLRPVSITIYGKDASLLIRGQISRLIENVFDEEGGADRKGSDRKCKGGEGTRAKDDGRSRAPMP